MYIEVKYYGSFLNKEAHKVDEFLVQIQKDIRLITGEKTFEYRFAQTKGIPDQATLHKQIKYILTDGKFNNKTPKGEKIWASLVGNPNQKPYSSLDKLIQDKFKLIKLK